MPHDANGKELKKGDTVLVAFEVVEVYPGAETCNVQLRQTIARKDGVRDHFTCTASTCGLVEKK